MSEVKKISPVGNIYGWEEGQFGEFVLSEDYDALAAEAQALREQVARSEQHRNDQADLIVSLRTEVAALRARVVVVPNRLPRREDQSESAQEGRRWGMSEVREVFEKRMAGIFDLSAYVDSQGDIRYSDSHTQAAWDGCQLVVDLFEPAPSVRQGMSLDHIGRLHALEKLRLRIAAHMFIRKNGELLGYGVTVPEMREFRELLIPFNGEIK
ncbi:TPA: hypothetical protein ACF3MW_004089 [Pseudomonas aeruginosa]